MDRRAEAPLVLSLAKGKGQRLLVEEGTSLVVMSGALRLCYPFAWLAERVVAPSVDLTANASFRLDAGGWIELRADADTELLLLPPEGGRLLQWLRRLVDGGLGGGNGRAVRAASDGVSSIDR